MIFDNGKVFQGEAVTVLRDLPAASVDAVVTDPPYSSGGTHASARRRDPATKYQNTGTAKSYPAMLGDSKDQRSYALWATLWLAECWRIARPGAPLLMFTDWRQLPLASDVVQAAGWEWRGLVIWHKPSARPMLGEFRRDAEYVVYAVKPPFQRVHDRCLPGIFRHAVNTAAKVHLTSKPIPLIKDLLAVTPEGGTVLDPFLGGGTTALACIETGRQFVGVELSPEYAALAADRIRQAEEGMGN
ncbi:DNA-methyltransferase [Megalodesulfovibrio paquesii]